MTPMAVVRFIDNSSRSLRRWLWLLLPALALTGTNAVIVNPLAIAHSGAAIFDTNPLQGRAGLAAAVPALAEEGWTQVVVFYAINFVFPLLLGLALAAGFAFGLRQLWPRAYDAGPLRWLVLLPLVVVGVDWAENVAALGLLGTYPPVDQGWLTALVVIRAIKLGVMVVAVVCAGIGAAGLVVARRR